MDYSTLEPWIPGLTAFIGSTAGILVGWRIHLGRERREMRRPIYVEWLKVARTQLLAPPPGPVPGGGTIVFPTPEAKARMNELTVELQIVASQGVARAANDYLLYLFDPSL